jgi:hypothetical protein
MNSRRKVKKYSKGSRIFLYFQDDELRSLQDLAALWGLSTQHTLRRVLNRYVRENKLWLELFL